VLVNFNHIGMRKFSRKTDQRKAFLKSLAANLILKGKIKTTEARAKDVRVLTERLISQAKKENLSGQRAVISSLPMSAAKKLIKEISPCLKGRKGGYTRLTKLGRRLSDGASVVYIELLKE